MAENLEDLSFSDLMGDNPLGESENKYFYEALKSMYSDLMTKTDIPQKEVKLLLRVIFYNDMIKPYDKDSTKAINKMLTTYYKYRISRSRLGRKEFFNALIHKVNDTKDSLMNKLRGQRDL